jgi:imidazoleglycerol-phosphate dehydratase
MRKASVVRETSETSVSVEIDLDGTGTSQIDTGIGFLDHMLTLFSFHSMFDLKVACCGDLDVDDHHTVEDIGITLGQCFIQALGDKRGIQRYGSAWCPMDESLALVVVDISGRPYSVFYADFSCPKLGSMTSQNVREFFRSFANSSGVTLHINVPYGENDHHKAEAIFKGFAMALKCASRTSSSHLPSSKGVI